MKSDDVRCKICGDNGLYSYKLYDDRYGYPGIFLLFLCPSCDHAFLQYDFSTDLLVELYSKYYPRSSFDIEQHKPHKEVVGLKAWFEGGGSSPFIYVPRNVRVLDIG
ncbi:MAG: hypothetical protein KAV87_55815, partial [Desulfobacteraceae bacterium]|nr:hypothetical protein [Desulfobacteraceae bacterium]